MLKILPLEIRPGLLIIWAKWASKNPKPLENLQPQIPELQFSKTIFSRAL